MGLARKVRSLFSSVVRIRGEDYAASNAVHLVDHRDGWAEMEVEGSGRRTYSVLLDWKDDDEVELECTCPHFADGNYCKHLWASIQVADGLGLYDKVRHAGPAKRSNGRSTGRKGSKTAPWQKQLDRQLHLLPAGGPLSQGKTAARSRQIFYLLKVKVGGATPCVELHQQEQRNNGQWGTVKPLQVNHRTAAEINNAEDRAALSRLLGNRIQPTHFDDFGYSETYNSTQPTRVDLSPELFTTVLPALAATGRFAWLPGEEEDWADSRPIAWDDGKSWKFRLRAKLIDRKRRWQIRGELVRGDQVRPIRDAVRCFSSGLLLLDDVLVRLETPNDFRWIETLRSNEVLEVPTKDRVAFINELWRIGSPLDVVGDKTLNVWGEVGTPTGRLVVHPPQKTSNYRQDRYLYASVAYIYDGHEASPNTPTAAWLASGGTKMISRDADAEAKLLHRLLELKLEPKAMQRYGETPPGHMQFAARELINVVDTLVGEGWVVEAEGTRIRKGSGVSLSVRSGVDWFDLEGYADFESASASLPDLLSALRQGERYVRLGDGSRGLLPAQWIEQFGPLMDLATKREGDALRFQPGQALLLDSMLAARTNDDALRVDRRFAALRKRLRSFSGVKPTAPPRVFQGKLRDYQREGLGWLRFLEKFGFGGCLADDMGLGKTIQALALLADRRRRQPKQSNPRPSLVVAPKSVVHNWRLEAKRFSPRLTVADYTGLDRKTRVPQFADYDLLLTTYGTLRQDIDRFSQTQWDYVILDEAQAIKNAASQSAKASRLLDARHRLALSGTPVENHLDELWSIFEFLNPGLLGRSKAFSKLTRNRLEADDARIEVLRKGLAPFLLRRTKKQVLPQLPEKTEQLLYCDLPAAQRKQYNQLRDHYRSALKQRISVSGLAKSKIQVLEALLRLRQAACHPGLIDRSQKGKSSAKLELLIEQLSEVVQEGHKALVFSQFTTMLNIAGNQLDKAGIIYEYLDGKTRNRQARVERFQQDRDCPLFLISLKAGGSGLNLTAADFVFLLDPWWNPAVEAQAIDRTHRIGQTKPVFAYRLISRDTVEEKILELQARKTGLAEAIISADGSLLKNLSAEDLQSLLS